MSEVEQATERTGFGRKAGLLIFCLVTAKRLQLAGALVCLAGVLCLLLHEAVFFGKGLVAVDGIFRLPPWKSLPHDLVSNGLLSDQYLTFLPLRHFLYENFRAGRFPLWNPFISCGVPAIGSMQTAPFFPINLLLLPVHPFYAGILSAFLKLLIAGAFTMLYTRRLGAGWLASLYSGLAFSLSGYMIVWLGHPHANSACVLPLLLYLMERALEEPPPRAWIGFALAYGGMLLGGHPATMVHISLGLLAYFLIRLSTPHRSSRWTQSARFALAVAAGLAIAAPQLLPYLEYYPLSSTAAASRVMQRWAYHLPLSTVTHFLMPLISGSPARGFEPLGLALGITGGPYDNFNERTGYVGVVSLCLAAAALFFRWDRRTRLLGASVLFCLYVIWGLPPVPQVLRRSPILNDINPTRLLLFVCFGLAILSGLGLDALERLKKRSSRRAWLWGVWVAVALTLFWLWEVFRPLIPEMTPGEKNFLLKQLPLFLGAALAATLVAVLAPARTRLAKITALLWCSFELLCYGTGYNPAVPRSSYYPPTKALEFLRRDDSLFRIAGLGWTLAPNTGIVYGLQDIRGQDFATVKRYEELITGSSGQFFFYTALSTLPPALASLGVKYLLAAPDWKPPSGDFEKVYVGEVAIHRLKFFQERVRLFFDYTVAGPADILEHMRSPQAHLSQTLFFEQAPDAAAPDAAASRASPSARVTRYLPDEVAVETTASRPAFLLLRDTFYPGWQATVNGSPSKIYRADYNFRAVAVPAGASEVRFIYAPASFYAGLGLAGASLALLVCIGLFPAVRRFCAGTEP